MSAIQKFCYRCKHFVVRDYSLENGLCVAFKLQSLVTGHEKNVKAVDARADKKKCGKMGLKYEEKSMCNENLIMR